MKQLAARSASRPAWEWLFQSDTESEIGRALASFERACYLELAHDNLVALVLPGVPDGPLNVVIEGDTGVFAAVQPGTPVRLAGKQLCMGALEVTLEGARVWEPRPDWEMLRAHAVEITGRLPVASALALVGAPEGSVLALLAASSAPPHDGSVRDHFLTQARQAAQLLRAGWSNSSAAHERLGIVGEESLARLRSGATQLAGLGGGLTPSGDDFLTGVMLWAWLAHPAPNDYCDALLGASMTHTTILSAALLRAAARGECSAPWHDMLRALADGSDADLARAVQSILSHGHTSGADALAGFLWTENR